METIADVIKRIVKKTGRIKTCALCGRYYDSNALTAHECQKESNDKSH